MGLIDECLRSLSEAMRMSQNNQDAESINHCILQLQEIAVTVKHPHEAIALIDHGLQHALSLISNPTHLLYATLSYAKLQRQYDMSSGDAATPQTSSELVTAQNVKWVELMHYAFRKSLHNYENYLLPGCKKSKHQLLQLPRSLEAVVKALVFDS